MSFVPSPAAAGMEEAASFGSVYLILTKLLLKSHASVFQ